MTKNKLYYSLSLFVLGNLIWVFVVLAAPQFVSPVLYPTLNMDGVPQIIVSLAPLLICDLVVLACAWLVLSGSIHRVKLISLILVVIIVLLLFLSLRMALFFDECFWISKTDNIDDFRSLDPDVSAFLDFENLTAEDIVGFYKHSEIRSYSYSYQRWNGHCQFELSFSAVLPEERFCEVYEQLVTESAFEHVGNGATGELSVSEEYYLSDNWRGTRISYDSDKNEIIYHFVFEWPA